MLDILSYQRGSRRFTVRKVAPDRSRLGQGKKTHTHIQGVRRDSTRFLKAPFKIRAISGSGGWCVLEAPFLSAFRIVALTPLHFWFLRFYLCLFFP